MTSAEGYLVQALVACLCIIGSMFYMFTMKRKYQKLAIHHVQCRMITDEGTGYSVLKPVVKGFVEFEPDKKAKRKGRLYPVADIATHLVDYPEGWCPSFIKTKIKEAVYFESDYEPISNRGANPIHNPDLLYNIRNERFTDVGVAHAQAEAEMQEKLGGKASLSMPKGSTLFVVVSCFVSIGIGIYLYMSLPEILDTINRIALALGV